MKKTDKEFREHIEELIQNRVRERDEQLEQVEKSLSSEDVKEQSRKEIMENFSKDMEEMRKKHTKRRARTGWYDANTWEYCDGYRILDDDDNADNYALLDGDFPDEYYIKDLFDKYTQTPHKEENEENKVDS